MAPAGDERRRGFPLTAAIAAVLIVALVLRTASVLLVVFVAVLLAVYLGALAGWLGRQLRTGAPAALAAAVVVTLAALVGIGTIVVPPALEQLRELVGNLPTYAASLSRTLDGLIRSIPLLGKRPGTVDLGGLIASSVSDIVGFIRGLVVPYLKSGLELVIEAVAVLVMGVFLARDPGVYTGGLVALVPPGRRPLARRILTDLRATLRAWIIGQLVAMAFLGLLTTIGLWLLRVPYPLAFGTFAGVAAIVPFFGSLAATVLPALFALTVGGLTQALAVAALGITVHLVEANLVSPVVMERQLRIPPVLTIAGVLLLGKLLGTIGLLVALPTLAVTMVLVRHILLGEVYGDPVGVPESGPQPGEAAPSRGPAAPGSVTPPAAPAPAALPPES